MKIKKIRESRGLKQSFVASELGISRQWFAKLEQGKKPLSKLQKEKLSQIFNVPLEKLNE